MHHPIRHIAIAILIANLTATAAAVSEQEASGPQSPIDIDKNHTCVTALPSLVTTRRIPVTEVWRNTGSPDHESTVRVEADSPAATLDVGGKSYKLLQYHLHAPAEHEVNGQLAAMEIHYVFQAADGSMAVVARLVDEGPFNAELDPLLTGMPMKGEAPLTVHPADPLGHASHPWLDQPRSYRYVGSLTTPPFTTSVSWIVLADHVTVTAAQMARFKSLFPHGNTREIQPIEGRMVRTDVPNFSGPCPD